MFRSCTVQTNLDFGSEADMVKKLRVSLALQPIATALFANSPFAEGRTNGFLSYRSHVPKNIQAPNFGTMLEPRLFAAQDLLMSELLRYL